MRPLPRNERKSMPRVYHAKRRQRTIFRKLPFAGTFWFATDVTVAPVVRYKRDGTILGWATTGEATTTTVTPKTLAVVKVPQRFMSQNGVGR